MKALIVDDEEDIGDFLKHVLEEMGFEAAYVITGEEALARIEHEKLELLLVDMKLSTKVAGLDVVKAIREKDPKAIVIAMTGYVDIALQQAAENLGVHAYFEKPNDLHPEVLGRKVKALMEKRA